ncbi:MAG: GDP-mannose 4,6-dehydratase [Candidatus Eisenbacteria bacterium]
MKALVTGANGFAGTHLVEHLLAGGWSILGITNDAGLNPRMRSKRPNFDLMEVDICDAPRLQRLVTDFRPDHVFHLAAVTKSDVSRGGLEELYRVNVAGTENLLVTLLEVAPDSRVLVTSSSGVYAPWQPIENCALHEEGLLQPESVYGASKLAQETLAHSFGRTTGLKILRTRAFNHTGPGESPHMACSAFARQIVMCEMERGGTVAVGNLETQRDFCDVRDVVAAYVLVAREAAAGEVFNVCSGEAVSMRSVLETLVSMARVPVRIQVDPGRFKHADVSYQKGDNSKIRKLLGWKPEIPLEQTLSDLLGYWRERLDREGPLPNSKPGERRT